MQLNIKKTKNKIIPAVSILTIFLFFMALMTINVVNSIQKTRYEVIFDKALWETQQLQAQYYRFFNYVALLTQEDLPLDGDLQTEYAYLINRIDILRNGEINDVTRFFEGGNPIKLIFFINGELSLLSIDIDALEKEPILDTQEIIKNLQLMEVRINELVSLTNRNAIQYRSVQQQNLDKSLDSISWLVWFLLSILSFFIFLSARFLNKNNHNLRHISELSRKLTTITMGRMRFLSVLNHELRTPINGILSITNILLKSKISKNQKNMLFTLQNSGEMVLNNLNAFSDLSKLEANSLELHFSYGNLHKQLEEVCQRVSSNRSYSSSNLFSFIDLNLPSYIYSDFTRLTQILSALLENALILSSAHNISIVVRESPIHPTDWRPDLSKNLEALTIQVSVRAAGIALTDEQRNAIGSSFYYLESDDSRKYMTGLNLSICYHLAKVIGGQLQFSTQHGMGDEFWMDIPIYFEKDINKIKEEVAMENAIVLLEKKKVLIIEEEQPAHIINMQVSSLGMEPTLTTERLTGPSTIKVDIIIISNDAYLDELSYFQLAELSKDECFILSSNQCKQAKTAEISHAAFTFPLTQLTLRKTLTDYYQQHPF